MFWPIMNFIILTSGLYKLGNFLIVFRYFSQLILMIQRQIFDLGPFMILFISWIFYSSCVFIMIGIKYDDKDFPMLNSFTVDLFRSYRNALGDIDAPGYEIWQNQAVEHNFTAKFMVYFIWTFWFLNQFLMQIILMNFLIALVNQNYEEQLSKSYSNRYSNRCQLNHDCLVIKDFFGKLKEVNMKIIYSDPET